VAVSVTPGWKGVGVQVIGSAVAESEGAGSFLGWHEEANRARPHNFKKLLRLIKGRREGRLLIECNQQYKTSKR
jgi:hypothetical protein